MFLKRHASGAGMICPVVATLEHAPERLDAVRVRLPLHVLPHAVLHYSVRGRDS